MINKADCVLTDSPSLIILQYNSCLHAAHTIKATLCGKLWEVFPLCSQDVYLRHLVTIVDRMAL
jgi:hypothetical protein